MQMYPGTKPIPISRGTKSHHGSGGFSGGSLQAPYAPGLPPSLPSAHLHESLPDLHLPPSTPEAFSIAEASSFELAQRLIGVCSAPARTFIDQAARGRTTMDSGVNQQEGSSALVGAFRGLGVNPSGKELHTTNAFSDLAPLVGSYGARLPGRGVTLATSFRDPHHIPLHSSVREEGVELDDNSDEEWSSRRARGVGVGKSVGDRGGVVAGGVGGRGGSGDDESSDEEGGGHRGVRPEEEDEGVFGGLH